MFKIHGRRPAAPARESRDGAIYGLCTLHYIQHIVLQTTSIDFLIHYLQELFERVHVKSLILIIRELLPSTQNYSLSQWQQKPVLLCEIKAKCDKSYEFCIVFSFEYLSTDLLEKYLDFLARRFDI